MAKVIIEEYVRPLHRSVSQESSYSDCGLRYKLERVDGRKEAPAFWNAGGRAFHAAIEFYERHRAEGDFDLITPEKIGAVFIAQYGTELAESHGIEPDESTWRAAKKGTEGRDWWLVNGHKMCVDYVNKQDERPYEVLQVDPWWPDRTDPPVFAHLDPAIVPALERRFELDVDGVPVVGFMDQAFIYGNGDVLVQDLKTGARVPGDTFQLGVYAHALERCFGIECVWGSYWMARKAVQTPPVRLMELHPWDQVVYRFHTMDRAEKAGIYLPRVSSFCNSCGMRPVCPMHPRG